MQLIAEPGEDALDPGLGIVKVALHGADLHVIALLTQHLGFLHGADAGLGVKDDDAHAGHIPEALHGGLAGVAAGGSEDEHILPVTAFHGGGLHQMGQQAEGHILKGAGGAVEQLQHSVLPHGSEGR